MGEDIVTVRDFIENELDNRIGADGAYFDEAKQALAALNRLAAAFNERGEALKPFAESLVAQTTVEHHSQDWREETDNTVVSIATSHQRKGMPYLAPDRTLAVGDFRRALKVLQPLPSAPAHEQTGE